MTNIRVNGRRVPRISPTVEAQWLEFHNTCLAKLNLAPVLVHTYKVAFYSGARAAIQTLTAVQDISAVIREVGDFHQRIADQQRETASDTEPST